jgi:hypothetical protein
MHAGRGLRLYGAPHAQALKAPMLRGWHSPPSPHRPPQLGYGLSGVHGIGAQKVLPGIVAQAVPFGHSAPPWPQAPGFVH